MIYTSSSQALAALENVVHRSGEGLNDLFRVMTILIPDDVSSKVVKIKDLPENWHTREGRSKTRLLGNEWIRKGDSLLLRVPSAIITGEANIMINPNHPDFKKVKVEAIEPFDFDPRIKGGG